MKVLITGNLGFVGKETVALLQKNNIECVGYDIMGGDDGGKGNDIRDIKRLEECISNVKPDRILHLAATARFIEAVKHPLVAFQTNAWGTFNIAKLADKYHIPIVYSSTGAVYFPVEKTPPITEEFPASGNSAYSCSKFLGEAYIKSFQNPYIILRYGHLYGKEKQYYGLIGAILSKLKDGKKPMIFGGQQSNDFAYVKDIALANYLALTAGFDRYTQIYNIGSGVEITAIDAAKIICEVAGYKGEIDQGPARSVDSLRFVYDMSKAEGMLGFKAQYSFKEGLEDMLKEPTSSDFDTPNENGKYI